MISYTSLQFYINAAFEAPVILSLIIIVVSIILRNKRDESKRVFIVYVVDHVLLLLCNMITWILDGMFVSPTYLPGLYKLDLVLTVLDYFFYCLSGVLFFNYVLSLVDSWSEKKRIRVVHILIGYAFLLTGFFASSIHTGWLYVFADDGYTYYTLAYGVLLIISVPGIWMSFFEVFKNKKRLGKRKVYFLLSYMILPMILLLVDQLFSLSLSYLALAFNAILIHIGIDSEQDREILKIKADLANQKTENMDMKVKIMISQIQPHFLYNTLGSIYQLCDKNVVLAKETIKNFTKFLRTNMESLEYNTLIPFEKELKHTQAYLSIEQLRFSDVLNVMYDIECDDFELPSLSLQPIVENAVKYGVRSREKGGTVTISTHREKGNIYVSVHDDGMGFDTEHFNDDGRLHIGIANVRKRLEYLCGGKLEIESKIGVGTTATIILEDIENESASDR